MQVLASKEDQDSEFLSFLGLFCCCCWAGLRRIILDIAEIGTPEIMSTKPLAKTCTI